MVLLARPAPETAHACRSTASPRENRATCRQPAGRRWAVLGVREDFWDRFFMYTLGHPIALGFLAHHEFNRLNPESTKDFALQKPGEPLL